MNGEKMFRVAFIGGVIAGTIATIIAFFVLLQFIGCAPSHETPLHAPADTVRATPVVYWWDEALAPAATYDIAGTDSIIVVQGDKNMDANMVLSAGQQHEIWRVEWMAVGDTCWTYIGAGMIPPSAWAGDLPHSGIVNVKIFGLADGDQLMFWRSHPSARPPEGCFRHWRTP